ncbi:MAG: hypothetical protein PCFJNLEI_00002 [Verrucomicrobiae bacterium]|nr:hypothetical protein [Verrucomicrobiae bacterium]
MKPRIFIPCVVAIVVVIALVLWPRTQNVSREDAEPPAAVAQDSASGMGGAPVSSPEGRSDLPVATGSAISAGNSHAPDPRATPTGRAARSTPPASSEALAADLPDPVATATIQVGTHTFRERSNEHGVFNEIRIQPNQPVAVAVAFGAGEAGQRVVAMVEDGGTLQDGQRVLPMELDAHRTVAFQFNTGDNRGIYRIRLRRGTETKLVQFWAGEPLALATR